MTKQKFYKAGCDKSVYRYFNEFALKNMTERERAMWIPFSDENMAPIPKEVIEFEKEQADADSSAGNPKSTLSNIISEEAQEVLEDFKYADAEVEQKFAEYEKKKEDARVRLSKSEEEIEEDKEFAENNLLKLKRLSEDEEKAFLKEQLRKRGIKFSHNAGLENLRSKIVKARDDANNREQENGEV